MSGLAILALVIYAVLPPWNFVPDTVVSIKDKSSSIQATYKFGEQNIVRSTLLLHTMIKIFGGEKKVKAGDYLFEKPQSVWRVAWRLTHGEYGFAPRKITLPEGLSSKEMAEILQDKLINFNSQDFINQASSSEGYLFPDTYLLMPTSKPDEIIKLMTETFDKRIKEIDQQIVAFNRPLRDIVNMASIVEEEANDEKSRRIVAGILWKRLKLGMPLQVDSSFRYINGKTTEYLTKDDLKIDSPYNTYKYKGLPPTPITNPGLLAISATVTPIDTPYFYFLTGKDGEMYYAKTYSEHLALKAKYLDQNK